MPGMRSSDVKAHNPESQEKQGDHEIPTVSEEKVNFDGDSDQGYTKQEGVKIEKVEEGVEKETKGAGNRNVAITEDEYKKKHAELLRLPSHGSVVYLCGFPHNASEEDLRDFCQSVGDVFECRLGLLGGGKHVEEKVYAFVTFKTKEMASKAIEDLNKSKFQGNDLICSPTEEKHRRLFIGNIPRQWTEEDMRKVVTEIGPGVNSVELLKEPNNYHRNRGFAFIEYYNHACAVYSRRKMSEPNFTLDGIAPTVEWAEPMTVDYQENVVYVKNLPENINRDRLEELFEHHGKITKVVLPPAKAGYEKSRYGFVHFAESSSARKLLEDTEKYKIDGQVLGCSLAKIKSDQKSSGTRVSQNSVKLLTYPPQLGLGSVGGAYSALGSTYGAAGFTQPLVYDWGTVPARTPLMPMLLHDGSIRYALQQSGIQQHSHSLSSRGGGSRVERHGDGKNQSRYHPY